MADTILSIRNLRTSFISKNREVRAVDGIGFDVQANQIVCIVGESGSGKSVTSLSIMRLLPKPFGRTTDGEILFNGRDLLKLSESEMTDVRGNEISMIFQEPMTSINPVLTIGEQITEVLIRHRQMNKREALQKAIDVLRIVGVPRADEIVREYAHQLSGGLRQRVMIAMAMACEPKLLIADEPTTALDVTIQAQVLALMKRVRQEFGTSIIFITHDFGVVANMADQVLVMYAGQIVESASAKGIFHEPLHPYTKALLMSIPTLETNSEALYSIPGTVPDASNYPRGCRFAQRCPIAKPVCFEKAQDLREIRDSHLVRCDRIESEGA